MITNQDRPVVHLILHPSIFPLILRPIYQDLQRARMKMRLHGREARLRAYRDWGICLRRASSLVCDCKLRTLGVLSV